MHLEATTLLAQLCQQRGQRAFVGRVCMDRLSPDYYRDASADDGIAASTASVAAIRALDPSADLVAPIVTPRFAPSCSSAAMRGLAELARDQDVRVQTHVSENADELALVAKLFPDQGAYVDVYASHGLLGDRTVLAHAIHLSPHEIATLRSTRTKIAHCPCSNSSLTSGSAQVRTLLDAGLDVGLGTDVSGGYSPSILEETRQALLVSRHVAYVRGDDAAKLHVGEALFLATRGGAAVLGLQHKVGAFEVGMEWDAIMVGLGKGVPSHTSHHSSTLAENHSGEMNGVVAAGQDGVPAAADLDADAEGPVDLYGHESWPDKMAKWVYCGDDRNTLAVWVKGRLVHSRKGWEEASR